MGLLRQLDQSWRAHSAPVRAVGTSGNMAAWRARCTGTRIWPSADPFELQRGHRGQVGRAAVPRFAQRRNIAPLSGYPLISLNLKPSVSRSMMGMSAGGAVAGRPKVIGGYPDARLLVDLTGASLRTSRI